MIRVCVLPSNQGACLSSPKEDNDALDGKRSSEPSPWRFGGRKVFGIDLRHWWRTRVAEPIRASYGRQKT